MLFVVLVDRCYSVSYTSFFYVFPSAMFEVSIAVLVGVVLVLSDRVCCLCCSLAVKLSSSSIS